MFSLQATPVFKRVVQSPKRINVLRGGTRSSKSYSMTQIIVLWLWTGTIGNQRHPKGNWDIIRETFPALRKTVLKDFTDMLHQFGIYPYIEHKKSVHEFVYRGRTVSFYSVDDPHKLRGQQRTFAFLNEADAISWEAFNQVMFRTEQYCFLDCNPSNSDSWIKKEIEDKRFYDRGDVTIDVSTYKDNPFLPKAMVDEIKGLKFVDPDLYKVYTTGQWVRLKGLIYNYEIVEEVPATKSVRFGLDWGFNDPTCLIACTISGNDLYLKELLWTVEEDIEELGKKISKKLTRVDKVYCDNSRPELIKFIRRRHSVNASSAPKGRDSIFQGIMKIKQYNIKVHKDSKNLIDEMDHYKWAEDKEGRPTDKPIETHNHGMDAIRYALCRTSSRISL